MRFPLGGDDAAEHGAKEHGFHEHKAGRDSAGDAGVQPVFFQGTGSKSVVHHHGQNETANHQKRRGGRQQIGRMKPLMTNQRKIAGKQPCAHKQQKRRGNVHKQKTGTGKVAQYAKDGALGVRVPPIPAYIQKQQGDDSAINAHAARQRRAVGIKVVLKPPEKMRNHDQRKQYQGNGRTDHQGMASGEIHGAHFHGGVHRAGTEKQGVSYILIFLPSHIQIRFSGFQTSHSHL